MKGKSLKWLSLIPVLIIGFSVIINTATAPVALPTVYVDPPEISANPGDTFTINVNIKDVTDLFSYDVRIKWQRDLLQILSVTEGSFLSSVNPTYFLAKSYTDYTIVACTTMAAVPGISGSGTLFTVNFKVLDAGKSALDIYQSTLVDSGLNPMDHTAEDGYSYTTAEANLIRRSAWPEHHHYVVSKDEDPYQNLTGKVKNLGPLDLMVYVEFNLVRDDGRVNITQTATVVVLPGDIVDLTAMFGPITGIDVGKYYVNASCWYSYTGNYWAQGDKMKTFSFAAVP